MCTYIYIYIYTHPLYNKLNHHHQLITQVLRLMVWFPTIMIACGKVDLNKNQITAPLSSFDATFRCQKKNIKLRSVIVLAGYFFLLQDPYVTVTKNTHTWIVLLAILRYLINIKSPKYERNRKPISVSQCAHGEKILENLTAQRSLRSSNMLNLGSSAKYIHVQYYI